MVTRSLDAECRRGRRAEGERAATLGVSVAVLTAASVRGRVWACSARARRRVGGVEFFPSVEFFLSMRFFLSVVLCSPC